MQVTIFLPDGTPAPEHSTPPIFTPEHNQQNTQVHIIDSLGGLILQPEPTSYDLPRQPENTYSIITPEPLISFDNLIQEPLEPPIEQSSSSSLITQNSSYQLTDHQKYFDVIVQGYSEFTETHHLTRLNECIEALAKINAIYESLYLTNKEEALRLRPQVETMKTFVQEMNFKSPVVTKQDAVTFNKFFEKPIEDEYVDPDSRIIYLQPDHSELLRFGGPYWAKGEYQATGLLRRQKINGKLCDILYLKKQEDQILYEEKISKKERRPNTEHSTAQPQQTRSTSTSLAGAIGNFLLSLTPLATDHEAIKLRLEKRIQTQKNSLSEIVPEINLNLDKWRYRTFAICATEELVGLGWTEEDAKKHHAIIFYYKKMP